MSPFLVRNFSKTAEGIRCLRDAVLGLGFKLTRKETKEWDEYLERRVKYEAGIVDDE
jgi:hypothetical protein